MSAEYFLIAEQLKQQVNKTGETIDFCIQAQTRYDAKIAIEQFADALGRTYQQKELEKDRFYFEIVNHDTDKINVTIHYDDAKTQKTLKEYWENEKINLDAKAREVEMYLKAEAIKEMRAAVEKEQDGFLMPDLEWGCVNVKVDSEADTDSGDESSGEIDRDFEEVEDKTGEIPWKYVVIKGRYYDVEQQEPVDIWEMRDAMLKTIAKMAKKDEEIKKEIENNEAEIKRILTNSKLVDMEIKVSQKRKYKKDDVLQLIREAHSIGKGEFSWNG